jgi:hypothetical protein
MTNTQESIIEAIELAQQLIAKTSEQKLTWSPQLVPQDAFQSSLGRDFNFSIVKTDDGYLFSMRDAENNDLVLVEVESNPRYGYSFANERQLNDILADLYELARRNALKVEDKVLQAKNLLNSL